MVMGKQTVQAKEVYYNSLCVFLVLVCRRLLSSLRRRRYQPRVTLGEGCLETIEMERKQVSRPH